MAGPPVESATCPPLSEDGGPMPRFGGPRGCDLRTGQYTDGGRGRLEHGGWFVPQRRPVERVRTGFQVFGPCFPQDGTTASSVVRISSVPEPTSLALFSASGMVVIGLAHRRPRSA